MNNVIPIYRVILEFSEWTGLGSHVLWYESVLRNTGTVSEGSHGTVYSLLLRSAVQTSTLRSHVVKVRVEILFGESQRILAWSIHYVWQDQYVTG